MSATPIGDYGLIGDTRTAALVGRDGTIDWWCAPRFDSPPVFGRLVAGEDGGRFELRPKAGAVVNRRYLPGTATIETTWRAGESRLVVSDSMIAEVKGSALPETVLVRRVRVSGRPARVRLVFSPRFGTDRRRPDEVQVHDGTSVVSAGPMSLMLSTGRSERVPVDAPIELEVTPECLLTVTLTATSGPAVFVAAHIADRAAASDERGWRRWSESIAVGTPHRDAIVRSLITLQLLTYSPTGAPVAAPTTSLPEVVGGSRNWDYRFSWPRDACIGLAAFLAVGKTKEAESFLAWILHATRTARPRLPALLTVHGNPAPAERELPWRGFLASVPVRVGNGAASQHQLDGYGWVLDAAWLYAKAGGNIDGELWRALRRFADHVAATWQLPDAGIWERRDEPHHHVHSKLMAWVALDRAVSLASRRGKSGRHVERWRGERDAIAMQVQRCGYDDDVGSYVASYGSCALDASLLLLPVVEFDPDPGRVASTVDAIHAALSAGGPLLYRYREADGLDGREGAFLPCSFWLVQALERIGREEEAEALFCELVDLGGELGLYAEELEPITGEHLGNFPQAFTHATLVQAALALSRPNGEQRR